MSQNSSKKVEAPEMSKKTYKKEVAKQRQIKRLRKMKLRDRKDDVRISDVSDISIDARAAQKQEEPQADWLNDLVKTDTRSEPVTMPTGSASQDDTRCTAELPRSKSPINVSDKSNGSIRLTLTSIWDIALNNPKITILSVSAVVLAVLWKLRSSKSNNE